MLNRVALFASLDTAIAMAQASQTVLGVLVLRTQRMREFRMVSGYEAGERLAAAIHREVDAALRPVDEVVQIGECDFAVVLPELRNRNHAVLAAAKLIRALQSPLDIGDQQVLVSVSVGAATCPEDGTDAETLCLHADSACGDAIGLGERFALYVAPDLGEAFPLADLRGAIASNALLVYLQPIFDLQNNRMNRAESLSRWHHPVHGAVSPDAFIRVAEEAGLISELTRWNFNASLRHAVEARDAGHPLTLSLNISAVVLQQASFPEQLRGLLRFWEIEPESIVLEVTETALMSDLAHNARLLAALRDQGHGIAIDDFGTGYSSMAYLKRLPVTELKIDRSFIEDMDRDVRAAALVRSMIDLSHLLGIQVVAEGVENAQAAHLLREMGCDHAQGFHLGRPMPASDMIAELGNDAGLADRA